MDVFQIQPGALGDAVLVHQTGHIRRHHVFSSVANLVVGFFKAHTCRDRFVSYAESSAEPTTIVRAIYWNHHDAFHFGKQACSLVEWRLHDFRGARDIETPKGTAAVVDCDRVMKFGPRKSLDLQNVVEEFHQLIGLLTNVFHVFRLFEAIEVTADLLYAASGRSHDAIEILEVFDKEMLGGLSILLIAAIGHRLPATGLVERVANVKPKSLQKLQGGDPNFRIDKIDVARYEQTDSHVLREPPLKRLFPLRDHLRSPFPGSAICDSSIYFCGIRQSPYIRLSCRVLCCRRLAMPKRVLIADDETSVRHAVRSFIEARSELQVCEATDGAEALHKARELNPDLIVLDLSMPKANGVEVALLLHTSMPGTPVVLYTMFDEIFGTSPARTLGVAAIVAKSDGVTKLLARIEALLKMADDRVQRQCFLTPAQGVAPSKQ